jgi:hypothetical protein
MHFQNDKKDLNFLMLILMRLKFNKKIRIICADFILSEGIAFYIFLRYWPPTLNNASVICPKEHTLVASISLSNKFSF